MNADERCFGEWVCLAYPLDGEGMWISKHMTSKFDKKKKKKKIEWYEEC